MKVKCPGCKKETTWEGNPYRPFCSKRCKLGDLAAWASEGYRIPGSPIDQPADVEGDDENAGNGKHNKTGGGND